MENVTNMTESVDGRDIPLIYTISYCAIYPFICIIGLLGNILTIIIVSKEKKWSSSTRLISSLSLSDSFVLISRLFYVVIRVSEIYFQYPTKLFTQYVPSYALLNINIYMQKISKMILVQIGVERLFAVWFPLKSKLLCTQRKTMSLVISHVLVVSSICIPIIVDIFVNYQKIISYGGEVYTGTSATLRDLLRYYKNISQIHITLFLVSRYCFDFFPLLFLAISSSLIVIGIRRSTCTLNIRNDHRKNQSKQMTKMLVCVCFVFVVLCLPNDFLSVALNSFGLTIPGYYYIIFDILSTLNNAVNFIFYGAFHTTYREQYTRFLSCFCGKGKHKFTGSQTTSAIPKPKLESSSSYIEKSLSRLDDNISIVKIRNIS